MKKSQAREEKAIDEHKRRASLQAQCRKPPAHTWVTHIFRGLFNFPLMENIWQMRGGKWIRDGTTGEKKKHRYLFFLSSTDEHIALTVTCYRDRGEGWRRRDDNISHLTQCHIMSGKRSSGILLRKARCFIPSLCGRKKWQLLHHLHLVQERFSLSMVANIAIHRHLPELHSL